jgi:membrane protein YqaA with SNARE-associated domain
MGRIMQAFSVAVISVFLISAALSVAYRDHLNQRFAVATEQYGQAAVFVFVFLLEAIPQPITPDFVVLTAFLAGLSPIVTISVAIFASFTSSILTYEIGKHHGPKKVKENFKSKRARKFIALVKRHGKWAIFLAAVSPLPYIPILIGAMDFSRATFISFGLIPRMIGMALRAYIIYIVFV